MNINVEIKVLDSAKDLPLPCYQTNGSAGMDIMSVEDIILMPSSAEGNFCMVSTGICVGIPKGYEGQIRPRSGLACKIGVSVINSPGTIDSDYTGEIKVGLINHSHNRIKIKRGERIAQIVFSPVAYANLVMVDDLKKTERGENGFGSTGKI